MVSENANVWVCTLVVRHWTVFSSSTMLLMSIKLLAVK